MIIRLTQIGVQQSKLFGQYRNSSYINQSFSALFPHVREMQTLGNSYYYIGGRNNHLSQGVIRDPLSLYIRRRGSCFAPLGFGFHSTCMTNEPRGAIPHIQAKGLLSSSTQHHRPSITGTASADVRMSIIADHESVPACQPKPSEYCTRYVM